MKKYLVYHQTSEFYRWDYYQKRGYVEWDRSHPRLNLACCGLCSKNKMINVLAEHRVANKNWIRQRIGEMANKELVALIESNKDYILVLNDTTKEIIEKYPINTP